MLRSSCRSCRAASCCRTDDAGKRDRIGSDVIERLGGGKGVLQCLRRLSQPSRFVLRGCRIKMQSLMTEQDNNVVQKHRFISRRSSLTRCIASQRNSYDSYLCHAIHLCPSEFVLIVIGGGADEVGDVADATILLPCNPSHLEGRRISKRCFAAQCLGGTIKEHPSHGQNGLSRS